MTPLRVPIAQAGGRDHYTYPKHGRRVAPLYTYPAIRREDGAVTGMTTQDNETIIDMATEDGGIAERIIYSTK